jgi:hypothetical protein
MTVLDRMILDPRRSFGHIRDSWVGSLSSFSKRKSKKQLHPFSAAEQQRRMQEAEVERWSTTTRFRWRKCFSCSCFSAAHLAACDVCGAPVVFFDEIAEKVTSDRQCTPPMEDSARFAKVSDSDASSSIVLEHIPVDAKVEKSSYLDDLPKEPEDSNVEECENAVDVPGALEESPPVGTRVEVLFEDDEWWPARIVEANGSKATILYDDGEEDRIDLEYNAVRLMDKDLASLEDAKGKMGISLQDKQMPSIQEGMEDDYDDDSEYEYIPGTLDLPPAIGTLVKVLHEDDVWRSARIIGTCGSTASIVYGKNIRSEVDFARDAVRLHDYTSDDEGNCDDEEVVVVGDKTKNEEKFHDRETAASVDLSLATLDARVSDDDTDNEYVELSGLLDEPPPTGAQVEILHEDEKWWPARIVETNGSKAKVLYVDGEIDEVDFECDPIRAIDYLSDNEEEQGQCVRLMPFPVVEL